MSQFAENYNKKISFIFMSFLIAISCLTFNAQNKTDHVTRKNISQIERDTLLQYEYISVNLGIKAKNI